MGIWKQNTKLVMDIFEYLEQLFYCDLKKLNLLKIESLIGKWIVMISKHGEERAVNKIINELRQKRSKLPWTMFEVRHGIEKTVDLLS